MSTKSNTAEVSWPVEGHVDLNHVYPGGVYAQGGVSWPVEGHVDLNIIAGHTKKP